MGKTVFIIGYVWPEPATTAAGHRMLQLILFFKTNGYTVVFGTTATKTEHSLDLDTLEVETVSLKLNHSSFDTYVQDLHPTMVIFDRFMVEEQFGWRVAEFVPSAIRTLNTEDLHSLRTARAECVKKGQEFTLQQWKSHPKTMREVASIYRSDCTLLISSYEVEILESRLQLPANLLFHLPFLLEKNLEADITRWPNFENRKDFVCIGNGKHAPNVDSIVVLKNNIWPLITKVLPDAKLHIHGAYLSQQVLEMHNPKEGFYVKGWARDLKKVVQNHRILLAPLQFGAGIKGKLIDAMTNGTPSITTSVGAEGMHENMPWNGTITDDWETFAKAAITLYSDEKKWLQAQRSGVSIINQLYDKDIWEGKLMTHLETLQSELCSHRNNNFIGKLLQQQTMASTKYMAKWIEAKNNK
ncbi:glycosyltransferase family 4 protein [Flagellimonas sp. HMM57]|uniref:glycosyltransferase n=1 Tax=unclassified Flagellimonas TaxID=2644544 RepID=UPI0013D22361|nr:MULTISPECIES: glycosyltransferase [unclassified Flagellimonas]UII75890.1 glycosyltransferase family 4 protein [Flagellimonas sp. HMM57]